MNQQLGIVMLMGRFYPSIGGYQFQALRLAREMIKRNMRVYIVTRRYGPLPRSWAHYKGLY
ncbi:MAG: hypothetical protein ACE5JO_05240, partial [Candidatus Binatia bacterium]